MDKLIEGRIDRVLNAAAQNAPLIVRAHIELGIPLEDLICAAVRRAASLKAIEAGQQELALGVEPDKKRRGA